MTTDQNTTAKASEVSARLRHHGDGTPEDYYSNSGLVSPNEAADLIDAQSARIAELERDQIAEPAECYMGCDDPQCPYLHTPVTWKQRADAAEALLREAREVLGPFLAAYLNSFRDYKQPIALRVTEARSLLTKLEALK